MAILDPPFSILDLANARGLPLSHFEQPAKGIFGILLGRVAGQVPSGRSRFFQEKGDLHFLLNLLGVILLP